MIVLAAAVAGPQEDSLRAIPPPDDAVPGWTRDGGPQEFEGEDLYTYIDGGAEIYQEYGFRRAVVQDYRDAAGRSVSLEVFEMASPAAAYGMFTFKRSGRGKTLALGNGAELEAYYLNFWKGRFLATLTGFDDTAATLDGLVAVAGAVDSRIRESGEPPALVAALAGEGLMPGSVRYIKGLLGLNNVYPFPTARGLAFAEGVRGMYGNGATLVVLDYGTAEARSSAKRALGGHLEASGEYARLACDEAGVLLFRDGKGRCLALAEAAARLLIGIGPDPGASLDVIRRAR